MINSHENGYTITDEATNETVELVFDKTDDSWSAVVNGECKKFLTFVDDNHVNVYGANGEAINVELSKSGVMAFEELVKSQMELAMK